MKHAQAIIEPTVFLRHTAERAFIGPGLFRFDHGELLMAAPWGRPPTGFEQLAARHPVPTLYRSQDGGRTWQEDGRMRMDWALDGMISDGGISFLRLQDGRLAFIAHRHVAGFHGGGLPIISFSTDEGRTWTPAKTIGAPEGVWYIMNDRAIQLRSGRLVVPVSHMPDAWGSGEGDRNLSTCFLSDDGGRSWRASGESTFRDDKRGMAEPCVAEVDDDHLLMLARTGSGCNYAAWSTDGGETWSPPERTSQTAACSPLTLKRLPDGRLIVFYNHCEPLAPGAFFPRTPLCYSVSDDGGRTWGEPVLIDESGRIKHNRQCIYPSICFTPEGMVLVYSVHVADPDGSFANSYSHVEPDCGAKRAILAYPA